MDPVAKCSHSLRIYRCFVVWTRGAAGWLLQRRRGERIGRRRGRSRPGEVGQRFLRGFRSL